MPVRTALLATLMAGALIPVDYDFTAMSQLPDRISFSRASTAMRTNAAGVLESVAINLPRFDYRHNPISGLWEPAGLLLEEQRTNLLLSSGDLNDASVWTKASSLTVTSNSDVAPDGTATADTLVDAQAGNVCFLRQTKSVANDTTTYTGSIFIKKTVSASFAQLQVNITNGATVDARVTINTATGEFSETNGATARVVSVGDYWRVSKSITNNASGNTNFLFVLIPAVNTALSTSQNIVAQGAVVMWGAQLEVGAFATSYIPTTTASVTRSADVASMTGASFSKWFNAAEGTFFIEAEHTGIGAVSSRVFAATVNNNEAIEAYSSANTTVSAAITSGGVQQAGLTTGPVAPGVPYRLAFAYAPNDAAISLNGAAAATDNSVTLPTGINHLRIGNRSDAARPFSGHIRKMRYYRKRLSDAQLQGMTA